MKEKWNKMTIRGKKSAIIYTLTTLNNPDQVTFIRDNFLVFRHGSWQLRDKMSVMLDPQNKYYQNYLSKVDKKLSQNDNRWVLKAILLSITIISGGILIGLLVAHLAGCF